LVIFLLRRHPSPQFNHGAIEMSNRFLSYLVTGALGVMLVLASPAFGRGGGGGGGMMGGGGHGGGMGGGGHGGGMGGGHFASMGGGHFAGMGGGHFAGAHFVHGGFPHRFAFHDHGGFRHRVFDRRLHRFVFIGGPYVYASYDSCYRRVWTPVGLQWVNICGDYNYGY
jgi:hypothetical protein